MQCLDPYDLAQFVMQVANWFYYNGELQMLTFATDYGVFQWSQQPTGLFCFDGQLS